MENRLPPAETLTEDQPDLSASGRDVGREDSAGPLEVGPLGAVVQPRNHPQKNLRARLLTAHGRLVSGGQKHAVHFGLQRQWFQLSENTGGQQLQNICTRRTTNEAAAFTIHERARAKQQAEVNWLLPPGGDRDKERRWTFTGWRSLLGAAEWFRELEAPLQTGFPSASSRALMLIRGFELIGGGDGTGGL